MRRVAAPAVGKPAASSRGRSPSDAKAPPSAPASPEEAAAPVLPSGPAVGRREDGRASEREADGRDSDSSESDGLCGQNGCTLPAWHAGICKMPLMEGRRARPVSSLPQGSSQDSSSPAARSRGTSSAEARAGKGAPGSARRASGARGVCHPSRGAASEPLAREGTKVQGRGRKRQALEEEEEEEDDDDDDDDEVDDDDDGSKASEEEGEGEEEDDDEEDDDDDEDEDDNEDEDDDEDQPGRTVCGLQGCPLPPYHSGLCQPVVEGGRMRARRKAEPLSGAAGEGKQKSPTSVGTQTPAKRLLAPPGGGVGSSWTPVTSEKQPGGRASPSPDGAIRSSVLSPGRLGELESYSVKRLRQILSKAGQLVHGKPGKHVLQKLVLALLEDGEDKRLADELMPDMLSGKIEYARDADGSSVLVEDEGEAYRDVCDLCGARRSEAAPSSKWHTCEQCVGLDVCDACLPTLNHPHKLVARLALGSATDDVPLVEAVWAHRMHGRKIAESVSDGGQGAYSTSQLRSLAAGTAHPAQSLDPRLARPPAAVRKVPKNGRRAASGPEQPPRKRSRSGAARPRPSHHTYDVATDGPVPTSTHELGAMGGGDLQDVEAWDRAVSAANVLCGFLGEGARRGGGTAPTASAVPAAPAPPAAPAAAPSARALMPPPPARRMPLQHAVQTVYIPAELAREPLRQVAEPAPAWPLAASAAFAQQQQALMVAQYPALGSGAQKPHAIVNATWVGLPAPLPAPRRAVAAVPVMAVVSAVVGGH